MKSVRQWGTPGIFGAIVFFLMFFVNQATARPWFQVTPLFSASDFTGMRLGGRSVLVFPPLMRGKIDTACAGILIADVEFLSKIRSEIRFDFDTVFIRDYRDTYGAKALGSLIGSLTKSDVIKLQANDSLWSFVDQNYLLVLRIENSVRIRTYEGRFSQRVQIDGDLWNKEKTAVVWRARVLGFSSDRAFSDRILIRDAVRALIQALPAQKGPPDKEEEW